MLTFIIGMLVGGASGIAFGAWRRAGSTEEWRPAGSPAMRPIPVTWRD